MLHLRIINVSETLYTYVPGCYCFSVYFLLFSVPGLRVFQFSLRFGYFMVGCFGSGFGSDPGCKTVKAAS